ncbi:unnamed protein product [Ceratitis capitata]|uniref:(Mediterranean fruit fly) hypothetical protein n=1 Tax=Ceratitis capitata TaxID=7213 RepID=A0A811U1J1_CERCA|nr:unnamed protein product [Ceratitis capitata]
MNKIKPITEVESEKRVNCRRREVDVRRNTLYLLDENKGQDKDCKNNYTHNNNKPNEYRPPAQPIRGTTSA